MDSGTRAGAGLWGGGDVGAATRPKGDEGGILDANIGASAGRRRYMAQPRVILYWVENSTIKPTCLGPFVQSGTTGVALRNAVRFMPSLEDLVETHQEGTHTPRRDRCD